MGRFRVGDVCVFTESAIYGLTGQKASGLECTVIDGLKTRWMWPPGEDRACYEVMCEQLASHALLAEPYELRLRRPPSWDRWLYDTRDVERECKEWQPA